MKNKFRNCYQIHYIILSYIKNICLFDRYFRDMKKKAHEIRDRLASQYIKGVGIEIGCGITPQSIPHQAKRYCFDLRDEREISALFNVPVESVPTVYPVDKIPVLFSQGADFLIAHNVIEHCSNPIKMLVQWGEYLKDGGLVVISAPHFQFLDDKERLVPPLEHVLFDYVFQRDDDSFESREHIYSFILGWRNKGIRSKMDKEGIARNAFFCAKKERNDLHWHAFDRDLFLKIIKLAALFQGEKIVIEKIADPFSQNLGEKTVGDIIVIARFHKSQKALEDLSRFDENLKSELIAFRDKIQIGLNQLQFD